MEYKIKIWRNRRMQELYVGSRTAKGEEGTVHRFDYCVVVGEMAVAGGFACESYGVKVQEQGGDTAVIPDLTVSAQRIDELMELLMDHQVGPAGLRDVVEDWL